jgi:hypothetical protein
LYLGSETVDAQIVVEVAANNNVAAEFVEIQNPNLPNAIDSIVAEAEMVICSTAVVDGRGAWNLKPAPHNCCLL